jgi:hypothetical protein
VFKYVADRYTTKEEFEFTTNQQFYRLFGRYMRESEFNNLCWWCRKNADITDTQHGYRLLLARMGRSRLDGELTRYMFLRRAVGGRYKRFTSEELVVGHKAVGGHSKAVTSHTHSILSTLNALQIGTANQRDKRIFRTLYNAVKQGHISAQLAAELINEDE